MFVFASTCSSDAKNTKTLAKYTISFGSLTSGRWELKRQQGLGKEITSSRRGREGYVELGALK